MRLGRLTGTIEQRLLINYRVDPEVAAALIPSRFAPLLVGGHAIGGVCLIELSVRPAHVPRAVTFRSFNAAHRFAIALPDGREGVYVPRRHTTSKINRLAGGRVFPGVSDPATITATGYGDRLSIDMASTDGTASVHVGASVAEDLSPDSVFSSVQDVSEFFRRGSIGYSDTMAGTGYEGVELTTSNWSVTPMRVDFATSSFFDDRDRFPAGTVSLDNALLMRNINHSWHARDVIRAA